MEALQGYLDCAPGIRWRRVSFRILELLCRNLNVFLGIGYVFLPVKSGLYKAS